MGLCQVKETMILLVIVSVTSLMLFGFSVWMSYPDALPVEYLIETPGCEALKK